MIRQILTMIIVAAACTGLAAKEPKVEVPIDQWMQTHAATSPAEADGVKMYYPVMNDGLATITAQLPVALTDASRIMTNALVANGESEELTIESVEPDQNSFSYIVKQQRGANKDAATFTYTLTGQCEKGQMILTAHSVSVGYREKGLIPRTLKVEKMNPANNLRHAALIDQLTFEASKLMAEIADVAAKQDAEPVAHWSEILRGEVVEGMNPTEVTLSKGKPFSVSGPKSKTKWRYEDNCVVIFTDGKVVRVII